MKGHEKVILMITIMTMITMTMMIMIIIVMKIMMITNHLHSGGRDEAKGLHPGLIENHDGI